MHCCLNGKAKNKKKKFRGGFAECNDHCTRQGALGKEKLKKTRFPSAMVIALGKENLKIKNKKHPLPSAGAVALGKEV